MEGNKELLGLWVGESEGAKFWLQRADRAEEPRRAGHPDRLRDGLKGFPEAIEAVFPKTEVQLCIVHMVRNSLRFVGWKERKAVAADLKTIYTAADGSRRPSRRLRRSQRSGTQVSRSISKSWRANWAE